MSATGINGISLEASDLVDTSTPGRVGFALGVAAGFSDEIVIQYPPEADISLDLSDPAQTELVYIGAQKWPIANLPVELGGW